MNTQINGVVSGCMKLMKMEIKGKGEISDESAIAVIENHRNVKVSNDRIFKDHVPVIKNKIIVKCIGVAEISQYRNRQQTADVKGFN